MIKISDKEFDFGTFMCKGCGTILYCGTNLDGYLIEFKFFNLKRKDTVIEPIKAECMLCFAKK